MAQAPASTCPRCGSARQARRACARCGAPAPAARPVVLKGDGAPPSMRPPEVLDLTGREAVAIDPRAFAPESTPTQGKPPPTTFHVQRRAMPRPAGKSPRPVVLTRIARPLPPAEFPVAAPPPPAPAAPAPAPAEPVAAPASAMAAPVLEPPREAPPEAAPAAAAAPAVVEVPPAAAPEVVQPPPPPAPEPVRTGDVEAFASVDHGQRPDPGMQALPFYWRDVVERDPPAPAKEGEGTYVVYHSIDVDQDVRITYQTSVSVRAPRRRGNVSDVAHRVEVDDRVSVQKRALLDAMDQARAKADHAARRSREALARKLARQRGRVVRWPRWAAPLGLALIRARARAGHGRINTVRKVRRGFVEVPDVVLSSALRVHYNLSTPLGRQALRKGLRDPESMNQDQRSAMLVLTGAAVAVAVLLANSVVALGTPEHSAIYRHVLTNAALQFVGLLGAPIIIEPLFIFSLLVFGSAVAFGSFFGGKMLGAWVLYLLGDSLHDHLKKSMKGERGQRLMAWMNRNANKWGFVILVLDNAMPLAPDQLMLALAVTGIRFRTWMIGIAVGTAIKFGALILGAHYMGHEAVELLFSNPFKYFGLM